MKNVALSTGLGEVMAPSTLMMPLLISPKADVQVDPGALHGRSELEQGIEFVPKEQVAGAERYLCCWVAIALDSENRPLHYKGIAPSELWIDATSKKGHKNLAEMVNRMSEALRGGVNVALLDSAASSAVVSKLQALDASAWEKSPESLKDALSKG